MKSMEERIQRLEDEAAIRNLAARFADAATRNDLEGNRQLWKQDGVFTISAPVAGTANGVDKIIEFIHGLRDNKDFFVQFIHSGVLEIDGDHAHARWLVREVAKGSGQFYSNFALFLDEMERIDGQWLFASRTYQYVYLDFSAFSGDAIALPAELGEKA